MDDSEVCGEQQWQSVAFIKHLCNYLLLCNKAPLSGFNRKQSFNYFPLFLWIRNLGRLRWTVLAWVVVGQWPEQLGHDGHLSLFMYEDSGPLHLFSPGELLRVSLQYGFPSAPKARFSGNQLEALSISLILPQQSHHFQLPSMCYKWVTGPTRIQREGK